MTICPCSTVNMDPSDAVTLRVKASTMADFAFGLRVERFDGNGAHTDATLRPAPFARANDVATLQSVAGDTVTSNEVEEPALSATSVAVALIVLEPTAKVYAGTLTS